MPEAGAAPLLAAAGLSKVFGGRRRLLARERTAETIAVREASFTVAQGASLGIVGESGSGKTTLARMLVGLEAPSEGRIVLDGRELSARPARAERQWRSRIVQIVFQDPYTSLDPRQSLRRSLDEVQRVQFSRSPAERRAHCDRLLDAVGLAEEARAVPRELSGGQRQRAAIARALAAEPQILILDEAVSALDVSIQAQILNLLNDLRDDLGLTYLFVSHDLAVIRQVADSVLVMYRGRVVESGTADEILSDPRHPYTQRLLQSVPRRDMVLQRQPAVLTAAQEGCLFRHRCPLAFDRCATEPELVALADGREARCWLAGVEQVPPATRVSSPAS